MELYHLINRGVDKRDVFMEESDYVRFIRNMFVFNDTNPPTTNVSSRDHNTKIRKPRKLLVKIHAFCLMPNHYHMLVSEIVDGGITLFMKKLNMGYSRHFNEKYERVGALWQGRYKKIHIEQDSHFFHIPYYIHLNPLDLKFPEWRDGKVKNTKAALVYLSSYRWSSHLDYLGVKNFPSLIDTNLLSDIIGVQSAYEKEIKFVISSSDIASTSNIIELSK